MVGVVTINNPEVDPSAAIADLPQQTVEISEIIASGCLDGKDNSFIYIARGGLPTSPMDSFHGKTLWLDLNHYTVSEESTFSDNPIVTHETLPKYQDQLIEATGWRFHPDGRVELVAVFPNHNWYRPVDCRTLNNL